MKKIFQYFIDNTFLVNLISIFVVVIGVAVSFSLKRDLIPQVESKGMTVSLYLIGASAPQMEKFVAIPVENSLKSISGIEQISSSSSFGSANINIKFNDNSNLVKMKQEVKDAVAASRGSLPANLEPFQYSEWKRKYVWVKSLGLTGFDFNNKSHVNELMQLRNKILSVSGVVKMSDPMSSRSVDIILNSKKLEKYGLSADYIYSLLKMKLTPFPMGRVEKGIDKISLELPSDLNQIEKLNDIVVQKNAFSKKLKLSDIAAVQVNDQEKNAITKINNDDYVALYVFKDLSSDIILVDDAVNEKIALINKELPQELKLVEMGSGRSFVSHQLTVLKNNALIGLALVLIILTLFLGFRVAFMTAIGLPLAYLGTVMVMYFLGIKVNLISVVSMILVLGVLVDDAIIIGEKFKVFLEEGLTPKKAAFKAALSMLNPVTAGVLTTIIAFTPILLLGGPMTAFMISIPIVVISSLIMSWLEAFFILPNHLSHFAKKQKQAKNSFCGMRELYEKFLKLFIRWRYVNILIFVGLFASGFYLVSKKIKTDFSLNIRPVAISVFGEFDKEMSKKDIEENLLKFSDKLNELQKNNADIDYITFRSGNMWAAGKWRKSRKYFEYNLKIIENHPNPLQVKKIVSKEIESYFKEFKKAPIKVLAFHSAVKGKEKGDLSKIYKVYFKGESPVNLNTLSSQVEDRLKGVKGFVSLNKEDNSFGDSWQFHQNIAAIQNHQISISSLARQVQMHSSGLFSGYVYDLSRQYPISLRFSNRTDDHNLKQFSKKKIQNSKGLFVSMNKLGTWKNELSFQKLSRKNGHRNIVLSVMYDDKKVKREDFKKSIEGIFPALKKEFPGYQISTELADESVKKSKKWMFNILLMCVLGIFFVLAIQLRSIVQTSIVCASILFGFIGVIWALYLHGMELKLLGMIGLLGVAGLSVNSSVILMDHYNQLKKLGEASFLSRLIDACSSRLRSIILTTLTTLGGLFPMAYAIGGDSGYTRPLAFSMAWGLLCSTLLTLLLTPLLIVICNDIKSVALIAFKKLKFKKKTSLKEALEI